MLLKDGDLRFDVFEGFPEPLVFDERLQSDVDLEVGHIVAPLAPQVDILDALEVGVQMPEPLGKAQMRTVKGKPYPSPWLLPLSAHCINV